MREKNKQRKNRERRLGECGLKRYFLSRRREKKKVKKLYLLTAMGFLTTGLNVLHFIPAEAESCPDVRMVFARGSGAERWKDKNYLAFKSSIEEKLKTTSLSYDFVDLDYPAVGVGIDNLGTTAGAYFGRGKAYDFGGSVGKGLLKLSDEVTNCKNTKYVLGGYSQGAIVVSDYIGDQLHVKDSKIIYAATFGDPKLYLPEGIGLTPPACKGKYLSEYRMYVPDCRAHSGVLGGWIPYTLLNFGKTGVWCNRHDFFCSSGINMNDHLSYISDGLYEDASRVIFDKIANEFGFENTITSPHDTAIVVDVSSGMDLTISRNAVAVVGLADKTVARGGRVALYSYNGSGLKKKYCDFNECTGTSVKYYLDEMRAEAEAANTSSIENRLMTSSFQVMNELTWQNKATKSLVAITNKKLVTPELSGTNLDTVVRLSKQIDPVNFYILADAESAESYTELAERTDGMVMVDDESLAGIGEISERILSRVDSLPRVEELEEAPTELPQLEVKSVNWVSDTEVEISFETNGVKTMVALNDGILGLTEEKTIRIGELDRSVANTVSLVAIGEEVKSEEVEVKLNEGLGAADGIARGEADEAPGSTSMMVLPKAPNTGKR